MLLTKDLGGADDGKENAALVAMLRAGNEFMTSRDAESEVQVSGEFAYMRRLAIGETLTLCAPFELPDARSIDETGAPTLLDDAGDRAGGYTPFKRTRLYDAFTDADGGTRGLDAVTGRPSTIRIPRFTKIYERVNDVDFNTRTGRGRVWHLGDGETLLAVREKFTEGDPRYFMGVNFAGFTTRRTRLSSVELVKVNADTGRASDVLLSFETFSGLGFDPGTRAIQVVDGTGSEAMYSDDFVYTGRAGHTWGRFTNAGFRMDPSSTYAVAEPAWHPDGFLSLVAVHARSTDALHPDSSIIKQLTCTRTRKDAEPTTSTITFPAHPDAQNDWSAIEVELLRITPTTMMLHVLLGGVLKPGTQLGGVQGGNFDAFYWSADAGATWTLMDLSAIATHGGLTQRYSGMMATGTGKALIFTGTVDLSEGRDVAAVVVNEVTASTAVVKGTIDGAVFNAGLDTGFLLSGVLYYTKYYPVGFGGGVRVNVDGVPVQRLWMQFDPFWIKSEFLPGGAPRPTNIQYPSTRPVLMVSDDGGVTWTRQFLPVVWQQRVGFVASWDRSNLLIPVHNPRTTTDTGDFNPLGVNLHQSKTGGATWRKTQWRITLPWQTFVDGQLLPGTPQYDIDDYRFDYNRGELFTLVPIRGPQGDVLPMNPGRPWIADARMEAP